MNCKSLLCMLLATIFSITCGQETTTKEAPTVSLIVPTTPSTVLTADKCTLHEIKSKLPKSCEVPVSDLYTPAPTQLNTWAEWTQKGLSAASDNEVIKSEIEPLSVRLKIAAYGLKIAQIVFQKVQDPEQRLANKVQTVLKTEFNELVHCIHDNIETNNAVRDRKYLAGLMRQYQEILSITSYTLFDERIEHIFNSMHDFVSEYFYIEPTDYNEYHTFYSLLPVWKSAVIFYDSIFSVYLTSIQSQCTAATNLRHSNFKEICSTFNDIYIYGKNDAAVLTKWINKAHDVIKNVYTPKDPISPQCDKNTFKFEHVDEMNEKVVFQYGTIANNMWVTGSSSKVTVSTAFSPQVNFITNDNKFHVQCTAEEIHCTVKLGVVEQETCCLTLKNQVVQTVHNQLTNSISTWSKTFKTRYNERVNAFNTKIQEIKALNHITLAPTPKPTDKPCTDC